MINCPSVQKEHSKDEHCVLYIHTLGYNHPFPGYIHMWKSLLGWSEEKNKQHCRKCQCLIGPENVISSRVFILLMVRPGKTSCIAWICTLTTLHTHGLLTSMAISRQLDQIIIYSISNKINWRQLDGIKDCMSKFSFI